MEIALGGGAVAAEAHGHRVVALELEGHAQPRRVDELARHGDGEGRHRTPSGKTLPRSSPFQNA